MKPLFEMYNFGAAYFQHRSDREDSVKFGNTSEYVQNKVYIKVYKAISEMLQATCWLLNLNICFQKQ